MSTTNLMACNSDWLDTAQTFNSGDVTLTTTNGLWNATNTIRTDWWTSYYSPVFYSSPARTIRLKLSEVERLRKAAKADDKLKAILQKFTDQIEIAVDFE